MISRSPPSLDSLEVVENIRPGGGFSRSDNSDSFAMEDPPSEEVRLDPRFNRVAEPATELIERDALLALANDFATEEMLAGPPPHPDEVTRPPTIELDVPVPGSVGPGPVSHSAAHPPPPSLEFALPIPLTPGPATQRDLRTEKVSRAARLDEPAEITVPSPHPAASWDAEEGSGPELTLPAPSALLAPDEVAFDVAMERAAAPPTRAAQEPTRALRQGGGRAQPPRSTPAPAPPRPSRSDASQSPPSPSPSSREGARLSPLVGLVALLGSGGVLAAAIAALLLVVIVLVLVFSGGGTSTEVKESLTLPPIEVVPVEPEPVPEVVEPEPEPEPEPARSTQPRPRPAPQPAPVEEAPVPEAPAPVVPPRPILDLDAEPEVPEDDKKGRKGKKKER